MPKREILEEEKAISKSEKRESLPSEPIKQPEVKEPVKTKEEKEVIPREARVEKGGLLKKARAKISDLAEEEEEEITSSEEPILEEVEDILEEDLEEVYQKMTPEEQKEFKEEGERAASRIVILLRKIKIQTTRIYYLIKKWLKLIPGINKFFLTQEAKIKTDKIIEMETEEREHEEK